MMTAAISTRLLSCRDSTCSLDVLRELLALFIDTLMGVEADAHPLRRVRSRGF